MAILEEILENCEHTKNVKFKIKCYTENNYLQIEKKLN